MKKLFISIIVLAMAPLLIGADDSETGCFQQVPCIVDKLDGTQQPLDEYCADVEAAGEKSLLCSFEAEYLIKPCSIHRVVEIITQEGLIFEGYTYEELDEWGVALRKRVENGVTWGELQMALMSYFSDVNKIIGAQVFILNNYINLLPPGQLIEGPDIELVLSSIDDVLADAKALDNWL